jgi:tRNA(Ile)-lysidine synthase
MLRLLRGSGVRGLRGIVAFGSLGRGFLGRPLLSVTRAQLNKAAREWGLSWIEDPSNRESRHDRNFLRLAVLPQLLKRWPAAVRNAGRLAEQMSEAEGILDAVAADDAARLEDAARVPQDFLAALEPPRQRNLLRHLLRRVGLAVPSSLKIEELRRALLEARADGQPLVRWPGADGRVFRRQLYLLAPLAAGSAPGYRAPIAMGGRWSGPEGEIAFAPAGSEPGIPESWLNAGLELRFRTGGELFRPLDRPHRQSLKHCFQARGLVPWMRSRVPLLFRSEQLVAVGDLWLAHEVRMADAGEPRWCVRWTGHPPVY